MPNQIYQSQEPDLYKKIEKIQLLISAEARMKFWKDSIDRNQRFIVENATDRDEQTRRATISNDPIRASLALDYGKFYNLSIEGLNRAEVEYEKSLKLYRELKQTVGTVSDEERFKAKNAILISTEKELDDKQIEMKRAKEEADELSRRQQEENVNKEKAQYNNFKSYDPKEDSSSLFNFKNALNKLKQRFSNEQTTSVAKISEHTKKKIHSISRIARICIDYWS